MQSVTEKRADVNGLRRQRGDRELHIFAHFGSLEQYNNQHSTSLARLLVHVCKYSTSTHNLVLNSITLYYAAVLTKSLTMKLYNSISFNFYCNCYIWNLVVNFWLLYCKYTQLQLHMSASLRGELLFARTAFLLRE